MQRLAPKCLTRFDPPQACHLPVSVSNNSRTHLEYDLTSMRKLENAMKASITPHPFLTSSPSLPRKPMSNSPKSLPDRESYRPTFSREMIVLQPCTSFEARTLSAAVQKFDLAWPPLVSLPFLQLPPSNTRVAHSSCPLRPNSIVSLKTCDLPAVTAQILHT